jgi:hypothetical protein
MVALVAVRSMYSMHSVLLQAAGLVVSRACANGKVCSCTMLRWVACCCYRQQPIARMFWGCPGVVASDLQV